MDDWVIIDTCVWASFFGKLSSPEKAAVDDSLDADRVAITGPILGEVRLGFRRKDQADWVASRLRLAHEIEIEWDDWRTAAHFGRELAGRGNRLPLTDLVVAALAIRRQAWVYTTDPHFDVVSNLKRYAPGAGHAVN